MPLELTPWTDLTPGTRVVVRRRLSAAQAVESGKKVTDLIGVVTKVNDTVVVLRPDAGGRAPSGADTTDEDTEQTIAIADIVKAKRIPPRPERRR